MQSTSSYHASLLTQRTRDALHWFLHDIRPFVPPLPPLPPSQSKTSWVWLHNNKILDSSNDLSLFNRLSTFWCPSSNQHSVFRHTANYHNTNFLLHTSNITTLEHIIMWAGGDEPQHARVINTPWCRKLPQSTTCFLCDPQRLQSNYEIRTTLNSLPNGQGFSQHVHIVPVRPGTKQ